MANSKITKIDILLVDDNPQNLRVLSKMFEDNGYEIRAVRSGEQVFKIIEVLPPDLILLDIHMPGMDGYEVCRRLKGNPKHKDIPVIFISALSETFNKILAFEVGGIDYITKPFQIEEVLARANTHLNLRRKTINLESTLQQLQKTQQQLIQAEKMASLGVMTAGISHEINNPLNFITASIPALLRDIQYVNEYISFIERKLEETSQTGILKELEEKKDEYSFTLLQTEILELVNNIRVGADRTKDIIRGLRLFARMDSEPRREEDITNIIELALTLLKNQYINIISINRDYIELPKIYCYSGKLNQVILNILSNAIDAIKSKEQKNNESITIKTYLEQIDNIEYEVISITDTGPGISENDIGKIFDPFFTTKEVGKGVGLGLSISHGIIQEHNGTIKVKSTPGNGTEFTIYLALKQGAHT